MGNVVLGLVESREAIGCNKNMKEMSSVSFFDLLKNSTDNEVLLEDVCILDLLVFENGSFSGSTRSLKFKKCSLNCAFFQDIAKQIKITFDSSSVFEFAVTDSVRKPSNISLNFENTLIEKHFIVRADVQELILSKCTIGSLSLDIKIVHHSRNLVFRKLLIKSLISLKIESVDESLGIYVSNSLSDLFHKALPRIKQNIHMEE